MEGENGVAAGITVIGLMLLLHRLGKCTAYRLFVGALLWLECVWSHEVFEVTLSTSVSR